MSIGMTGVTCPGKSQVEWDWNREAKEVANLRKRRREGKGV